MGYVMMEARSWSAVMKRLWHQGIRRFPEARKGKGNDNLLEPPERNAALSTP